MACSLVVKCCVSSLLLQLKMYLSVMLLIQSVWIQAISLSVNYSAMKISWPHHKYSRWSAVGLQRHTTDTRTHTMPSQEYKLEPYLQLSSKSKFCCHHLFACVTAFAQVNRQPFTNQPTTLPSELRYTLTGLLRINSWLQGGF